MKRFEVVRSRRTKRGGLVSNAIEQYVRDDIPCHSPLCSRCDNGVDTVHGFVVKAAQDIMVIYSQRTKDTT